MTDRSQNRPSFTQPDDDEMAHQCGPPPCAERKPSQTSQFIRGASTDGAVPAEKHYEHYYEPTRVLSSYQPKFSDQDILKAEENAVDQAHTHHTKGPIGSAEESTLIVNAPPAMIEGKKELVPADEQQLNALPFKYSKLEKKHLNWYKEINLRERYKISSLFALQRSMNWLLLTVGAWGAFILVFGMTAVVEPADVIESYALMGVRMTLLVFLLMAIYWELYRRTLDLRIVGFRVVVTRGVFWKVRGSMAIAPFMQIYIEQTFLDLIFDLYHIQMWLAGTPKSEMLLIPALSREDAYNLHNYLTIELSRQVFVSGGAQDTEDQMRFREVMADGEKYE